MPFTFESVQAFYVAMEENGFKLHKKDKAKKSHFDKVPEGFVFE